jgi:hypothetical protein
MSRELVMASLEDAGKLDKFQQVIKDLEPIFKKLPALVMRLAPTNLSLIMSPQSFAMDLLGVSLVLRPDWWATPIDKIPKLSDLLKVCASLASSGMKSNCLAWKQFRLGEEHLPYVNWRELILTSRQKDSHHSLCALELLDPPSYDLVCGKHRTHH